MTSLRHLKIHTQGLMNSIDFMNESKKKVLFIASIDKHIIRFHIPYLKWWKDRGWEVHVACNGNALIPNCDVMHQVDFVRPPFSMGHFKAYKQLKRLIDTIPFQIVHTHTPMASVLARLACKNARKKGGLKLLYTSHGFHFYKGGPLLFWMLYYPAEKFLAPYTDCIMTINTEDYEISLKEFSKALIEPTSGVGADSTRFFPAKQGQKEAIRQELNIPQNSFTILYIAEFIHRKNHEFIIRAATELKKEIPNIQILFAGRGVLMENLKDLSEKLGVSSFVHFLGFRRDIDRIIHAADVGVSSSRQEGLGMNLIEAKMCGLPVVATIDRGHKEIVKPGVNGFLFSGGDTSSFVNYLKTLSEDKTLYENFSKEAIQSSKKFTLEGTLKEMEKIYERFI